MIIFIIIIFFTINYLSGSQPKIYITVPPNILGESIKYLPPQSQSTLNHLNTTPAFIFIKDKIDYLKDQTDGFPQKQITEIKKIIVEKIYQDVMKSIK